MTSQRSEELYFRKAQLEQRLRQLRKSAPQTETQTKKVFLPLSRKRFLALEHLALEQHNTLKQYNKEEAGKARQELLAVEKKIQAWQRLQEPALLPWLVVLGVILLSIGVMVYLSTGITSSATVPTAMTDLTVPNTTASTTALTADVQLLIEGKNQYTADEQPTFTVKLAERKGNKLTGNFVALSSASLISVSVVDPRGVERNVPASILEGALHLALEKSRSFLPGRYQLRLKTNYRGQEQVQEQDFRWGVLAINFDKSVYREGEQAFIGLAVLNDQGRMVCDAQVVLEIVDPGGKKTVFSTADNTIKTSPECPVYGVTNLPDYYVTYNIREAGTYFFRLAADTANGRREMAGEFTVQKTVDIDVVRKGPTRIFPLATYTMGMTVTSEKLYSGTITETVPASFTIFPQEGMNVNAEKEAKYLSWKALLLPGQSQSFSYQFDAPDESPEFYLLGPLKIGAWKESRQWQIAADSFTTVILNSTNEQRNTTQSNLTVYQQFTPLGPNIKNITNWRINGTSILLINLPFEGINGTTTNNAWDYSGYGYNGSEVGGVTWNYTAGFDGRGAYEFDGNNDLIVLPNSFNAQPSTVLTITAWIFPKNCTNNMRIVTKSITPSGPGSLTGQIIFDMASGQQGAGCGISLSFINDTGVAESTPVSGQVMYPRNWYFVAATFNNSNKSTYVNGDLQTSNYSNSLLLPASPAYNWSIGEIEKAATQFNPSTFFNGTIDEVRIYNRSLSHAQIIALYKNRTDLIVSEELRPGQNWSVVVTFNNGTGDEQSVLSNPVVIVSNNTPTHDQEPVLNTTDVTKNDTTTNLTLYIFTRDPDLDSLKNITNWLLNGTSIMLINMPFEKFNSSTNNVARDYSGYGYNGTELGATWQAAGGFDGRGAYTFDGSNDRLFLNNSYTAQPTTAFTFTAWLNQETCTAAGKIFAKSSASGTSDPGIIVIDTSSDTSTANGCGLRFYFINPSGGQETTGASSRLMTVNTWYHVAATFNNSNLSIYVNGNMTNSTLASVASIPTSGYNWSFGEREGPDAGTWYYNGEIDDVRIFNRSLSPEQILALYNNKTNLIVSRELKRSQNWTADVTPNDGNTDGATVRSNSVLILNTPPTQSTPILNTTDVTKNDTNQNLTLYPQGASDVDGDSIKNITNWLLNGSSIMVLNMPFEGINNTASNNAWDYSGNGNNGSENGFIVWNATGGFDGRGAYTLNGIDDFIQLSGTAPTLNPLTALTVAAWVNPIVGGEQRIIVGRWNAGAYTYLIDIVSDITRVIIRNNTDAQGVFSGTTELRNNTWYFIVGTYNTTNIQLYVNGVAEGGLSSGSVPSTMSSNTEPTYIGKMGESTTNTFSGTLDDVRIFNRSLTAQQVLALFNNKTNLLVSQELSHMQNWTADVTPNDGRVDGAFARSNQQIIRNNRAPTQSAPILNTTDLTKNDTNQNLTLYLNVSDADGDSIKNITNWLLNGSSIMVLNMPFEGINDTASNNAWDYSGYGNNGSDNGGIVWNATGGFDGRGAYTLDGSDDFISLSGTAPTLNPLTALTVAAWVNPIVGGEQRVIVGRWNAGAYTYLIDIVSDITRVIIRNSTDAQGVWSGTTELRNNTWYLIVGTYNGTNIQLYVNGVAEGGLSSGSVPSTMSSNTEPTYIGRMGESTLLNFRGTLDDVRIFNRSLTAQQVLALFNNKTNLLVSQELSHMQNWTADVTPNDGRVDGAFARSNQVIVAAVGNTLPTVPVTLIPANGSAITNRTPTFTWGNATDADGDVISYHLQVDDNILFNNPEINLSAIQNTIFNAANTTYFSSSGTVELTVDTRYYWRVRANDSTGYGEWSNGATADGPGSNQNNSNFTVDSLLSVTMINNNAAFGTVAPGDNVDTTDGVPPPFRLENTGNIDANASINGSAYFTAVAMNRSEYQFRIRANESGAFDTALSSTASWINMSIADSRARVVNLTWRDSKNDFLVDINLTVPTDEPAGFKSSTITFTMTRNE